MIELKSRITRGERRIFHDVDTLGGKSEGAPPEVFEQIEAWVKVDGAADLPS